MNLQQRSRFNRSATIISAVASFAAGAEFCKAQAQQIYYADLFNPDVTFGSIVHANGPGFKPEPLLDTGGGLRSLAIDQSSGKLYWTDVDAHVIRRANLDGSDQQDLASGLPFASGIAIDPAAGKLYWGDTTTQEIHWANLDGSNPQLLHNTPFYRSLVVDPIEGKLYWNTSISSMRGDILRSNLDGADLETVITSSDAAFKPSGFSLDIPSGKIYWADNVVGVVRRANLDGTDLETIYPGSFDQVPRTVTLDLNAGLLYVGIDIVDEVSNHGMLMKMSLDGSFFDTVIPGTGFVNSIAIISNPVCTGDVSPIGGNGTVDVDDLLEVINQWGFCFIPPCSGDIAPPGGDLEVNVDDLLAVINHWGACP